MKGIIVILFICQVTCCYSQANTLMKSDIRNGYQDSLRKVITSIDRGDTPKINLISFCIPETNKESNLFFNLDQTKDSDSFGKLYFKMIRELAINGNQAILKKYLMLSQFEDGYFAEAYFEDDMDEIINKQHDLFCNTVKSISAEKRKRLSGVIKRANCK